MKTYEPIYFLVSGHAFQAHYVYTFLEYAAGVCYIKRGN